MLRSQPGFDKWDRIGISKVGELWARGDVIQWEDLRREYHMASKEMYRYLQITHAIRAKLPRGTDVPEASPLESRLL